MDCSAYQDEFSALLDGEEPMLNAGALDAHLAWCVDCAAWAGAAAQVHRMTRVAEAPEVPDLVAPILAKAHEQRRLIDERVVDAGTYARVSRLGLVAIAIAEIVAAVPGLFGTQATGSALHSVHELGSFDLALAVGFLFAAFRPSLAKGMLPLVAALVVTLGGVTISDVIASHAGWGAESVHLLAMLGVPMLWLASRGDSDGAQSGTGGSQWRHGAIGIVAG